MIKAYLSTTGYIVEPLNIDFLSDYSYTTKSELAF